MNLIPKTDDNYIGIEIECFGQVKRQTLTKYLKENKIDTKVDIGNDGSISYKPTDFDESELKKVIEQEWYDYRRDANGNAREALYRPVERLKYKKPVSTFELRVLVKQSELYKVLMALQKVLDKAKLKVNKSCGLHVHLDMRNRAYIQCAKRLYKAQPLMMKLVNKTRRTNTFCRPVKNENQLFNGERYKTINTCGLKNIKKHTIEIRVHHGTTNMTEIFNWTKFLLAIIDSKTPAKQLSYKKYYPKRIQSYMAEAIASNR